MCVPAHLCNRDSIYAGFMEVFQKLSVAGWDNSVGFRDNIFAGFNLLFAYQIT